MHDFIGNAHLALKKHILHHNARMSNSYEPYCAIVQSSGTGKSRTVDEFSKYNFVIPVNVRKPKVGGVHAHLCPLARMH